MARRNQPTPPELTELIWSPIEMTDEMRLVGVKLTAEFTPKYKKFESNMDTLYVSVIEAYEQGRIDVSTARNLMVDLKAARSPPLAERYCAIGRAELVYITNRPII